MFSCSTWWLLAGTSPAVYGVATNWQWIWNGMKPFLKWLRRLIDIWLAGIFFCQRALHLIMSMWVMWLHRLYRVVLLVVFRFGKVEDQKEALRLYTVQIPHKRDRRPTSLLPHQVGRQELPADDDGSLWQWSHLLSGCQVTDRLILQHVNHEQWSK